MDNLLLLLLAIFAGVAAMVMLLERFGTPMDEEQQARVAGWFPIVLMILALALVIRFFMG